MSLTANPRMACEQPGAALSNRSFDTDAQRRSFAPLRSFPPVAGQLRR